MTASLRRDIEARLPLLYEDASDKASAGLRRYKEHDAGAALPAACPYGLDEIARRGWYPANRHGLGDESGDA